MHNDETNAPCDAQPEALTALARVVEDAAERAATAAIERQAGYVAALERRLAAALEGAERAQRMSDVGADLMHALRAANEAQQIAAADCVVVGSCRIDQDGEPRQIGIRLTHGQDYTVDSQALASVRRGRYTALLLLYRKGDA